MDESFERLTGVVAIVGDILVYGKTTEEHDNNLRAVLKRAIEKGIRINEEKLEVGATEIWYFGHVLSARGLQPHPSKIAAMKDMAPPENRGWSGGAMVLDKLPVPGRPTIFITVGQGPIALAVGAGGVVWTFLLSSIFSPLSPSLWETARYRLKYCLKGPLNPKQPINQSRKQI